MATYHRLLSIGIGFFGYHWNFMEIVRRRRRGGLPLKARCAPWIVAGDFSIPERPEEINQGQNKSNRKHGCAGAGKNVQHLEFFRIRVITARHTKVAEDKLREERQVEADERNQGREFGRGFRIHSS